MLLNDIRLVPKVLFIPISDKLKLGLRLSDLAIRITSSKTFSKEKNVKAEITHQHKILLKKNKVKS